MGITKRLRRKKAIKKDQFKTGGKRPKRKNKSKYTKHWIEFLEANENAWDILRDLNELMKEKDKHLYELEEEGVINIVDKEKAESSGEIKTKLVAIEAGIRNFIRRENGFPFKKS